MSDSDSSVAPQGQFRTTRWSLVVRAARPDTADAREALAELCRSYWYPLYAYARRRGLSADDAQDAVQGFFARLLDKGDLEDVRREKGRFRAFLLSSLRHYLANERDRARTLKRGGGVATISIDAREADSRFRVEPEHDEDAEKIFERNWACTLLERTLERLEGEYAERDQQRLFDELKPALQGSAPEGYREIGERLELSEGAVKVAVHRLRQRYRAALREEIAHTVAGAEEIEDELRQLFRALGG